MMRFGSPLRVEEIKAVADEWLVSGYASTYNNCDLGGDIVVNGAFDRTLGDGHRVKFLHSHDPRLVLGVPKSLKSDRNGLFGTFKLSKTSLGEDTHQLLKDGALDSFSIGYIARGWEWQRDDKDETSEVRLLKDVDLLEVSLVAMPMNPEATVTMVKDWSALWTGRDVAMGDRARILRADLTELLSEFASLAARDRGLTDSKRDEMAALLATFAGLDAVRADVQQLLTAASPATAPGLKERLELARHRLRRLGILEKES